MLSLSQLFARFGLNFKEHFPIAGQSIKPTILNPNLCLVFARLAPSTKAVLKKKMFCFRLFWTNALHFIHRLLIHITYLLVYIIMPRGFYFLPDFFFSNKLKLTYRSDLFDYKIQIAKETTNYAPLLWQVNVDQLSPTSSAAAAQ